MFKPVIFGIGKLGRRLTVAFLGVALTAIIVMSGITELSTGQDINSLVTQQEDALGDAAALASGALYKHDGWRHADLRPVFELIQGEGGVAQVRDMSGKVVQSSPKFESFGSSHEFKDA